MNPESPRQLKQRRANRWPQVKLFLESFKPFLCPLGVAILLLCPMLFPWFLDPPVWELRSVKISGALFQLAGVASVVLGLSRSRETFGERGLWRWLRYVWRQFLRIVLPPRNHSRLFGGVKATSITVTGLGLVKAQARNTIEDRIAALERQVAALQNGQEDTRKGLSDAKRELTEAGQEEARKRYEDDQDIQRRMKEAVIGGIHLEGAGVCYIAVGIVLTTFPGGIAGLIY